MRIAALLASTLLWGCAAKHPHTRLAVPVKCQGKKELITQKCVVVNGTLLDCKEEYTQHYFCTEVATAPQVAHAQVAK